MKKTTTADEKLSDVTESQMITDEVMCFCMFLYSGLGLTLLFPGSFKQSTILKTTFPLVNFLWVGTFGKITTQLDKICNKGLV